jgi:hypothetical protein
LQDATQALYAKLGKTADKDAVDASLVPEILWRYVYGLYGLDADQLGVNFLTFTGDALKLTNPRSAQVLGSIAQTMNVYQVAQSLLSGLFGNTVSATTAADQLFAAGRLFSGPLVELVQLCSVASGGMRLMI